MPKKTPEEEYDELFIRLCEGAQRIFKRMLITLLLLLFVSQILLRIPAFRTLISSADYWEGFHIIRTDDRLPMISEN